VHATDLRAPISAGMKGGMPLRIAGDPKRLNTTRTAPDASPDPLLLTAVQAAALLGMSVRRFHQLRSQLPAPVVFGPRHVRWRRADLIAWVAGLVVDQGDRPEPPQLRAGKSRKRAAGAVEVVGESRSPIAETRMDARCQRSVSPSNPTPTGAQL
jgi:predicted DNA-binding transcriptional regulator AlpA